MKNCTAFIFPEPQDYGRTGIDGKLAIHWRPIGKTERECWGFVYPQPYSGEPTTTIANGYMIAVQLQKRILPADVVRDELAERVEEWELSNGNKVSAAHKKNIREEIELDLLPRCFVRKKVFYAWLGKDRLLIDSKKPAVCDAITSLLREAFGSLPCINVAPRSVPGAVMAGWVEDSRMMPPSLLINGEVSMRATDDDPSAIKIKEALLSKSSVDDALSCCPMIKEIALSHNDQVSFTLNEQLQLGKIKLSDTLQEQASNDSEGDKTAEQRASWLLEVTAINAALDDIFAAMGGLEGVDE